MNAVKFDVERIGAERHLADRRVHVAALVDAELDLAGLDLAHRALDVERDRAGLRVRHESARTEHATELADLSHLIGRGDEDVEVEPPILDARNELDADEVGARGLGLARLLADRDHRTRTDLPVPAGSTTVPRTT